VLKKGNVLRVHTLPQGEGRASGLHVPERGGEDLRQVGEEIFGERQKIIIHNGPEFKIIKGINNAKEMMPVRNKTQDNFTFSKILDRIIEDTEKRNCKNIEISK
jgi:hypothetical protein